MEQGGPTQGLFDALRACRLWRAASDDAVTGLAHEARLRGFRVGELVVTEGDPADAFGVVVTGSVTVYHLGADGRRLVLENAGPGEPVAAVAALAGGRYPAHAEATSDLVLAWLPREALLDLAHSEPDVAVALLTDLASRLVQSTGTVQELTRDVPSRLAAFLFQRSLATGRPAPDGLVIDLGMPKRELASTLGTVPETLSRALARLKREDLIDVAGRKVTVLDVGGLARRGAGYGEG